MPLNQNESNVTPSLPVPRKHRRWLPRIALALLAFIIVATLSGLWYIRSVLNSSLPMMNGTFKVSALQNTVRIERDDHGVPTIIGNSYNNVAFALGVLHAQERFFQMDLLRRKAAGELSALVGSGALPVDKESRVHRFRARMKAIWEAMPAGEQAVIKMYCQGVAWGLEHGFAEKGAKPFEYHVLRSDTAPWLPEDSLLIVCAMYEELQSSQKLVEMARSNIHAAFGPEVAKFFDPDGTPWDAPIDFSTVPIAPLPTAAQLNVRDNPALKNLTAMNDDEPLSLKPMLGSNNWAVSGKKTKHGGALVADDMHLAITMPNIWYRACMKWTDVDGTQRTACGVTLPGSAALVTGSNGYVAWGFTNTEGDWYDLMGLEIDPNDPRKYKTPTGWGEIVTHNEMIEVKSQPAVSFPVLETIWGPIVTQDKNKMPYAARWVAHTPEGVNIKLFGMMTAHTLEEALAIAANTGTPHQNFVCADRSGRIAWTIAGRIPKRSSQSPRGAALALKHDTWDGFLAVADYPKVVDPEKGRVWTANNRVVGGEMFAKLGNAGVDIGFRAGQIRDRLLAIEKADEKDMLSIQLDDEARSMQRWKALFLETVPAVGDPGHPSRAVLREIVANWDGFAHANGVGYYVLTLFEQEVRKLACQPFNALIDQKAIFKVPFQSLNLQQIDGPLWAMVTQKPMHLLHPRFESWQALFVESVDWVAAKMQSSGKPFDKQTWGSVNATQVRHPLSGAIPFVSRWLDMPDAQLNGARHDLPRVTSPDHGASERFAVSPGKEEQGIFHMPGGQSSHPLSPHYKDGHAAWEQGTPTPFLPGKKVYELVLEK